MDGVMMAHQATTSSYFPPSDLPAHILLRFLIHALWTRSPEFIFVPPTTYTYYFPTPVYYIRFFFVPLRHGALPSIISAVTLPFGILSDPYHFTHHPTPDAFRTLRLLESTFEYISLVY